MPTPGQEIALLVAVLDDDNPAIWVPWTKAFDVVKKEVSAQSPRYSEIQREDVLLRMHLELDDPNKLMGLRAEDMVHHVGVVVDGISVGSNKHHAQQITDRLAQLCARLKTCADAFFRSTGFYLFVAGVEEGHRAFDNSQKAFREQLVDRAGQRLGIEPKGLFALEVLNEVDLVHTIRHATELAMRNYSFRAR